jgi:hypothetical protein
MASFDARLCARTAEFFELHNRDKLRTGWLSVVPEVTALKISRDYKLFG